MFIFFFLISIISGAETLSLSYLSSMSAMMAQFGSSSQINPSLLKLHSIATELMLDTSRSSNYAENRGIKAGALVALAGLLL